ncbi:hypothetical protein PR048_005034 [Dryococelus australis]|uniref:Uncharacterized protein n=1 Tax=Dryococelus australis TaxID=614101 RepID=A0ABQ9I734_9NEOP|nr:hypothetical protein PR048_005034 [Dryococelus australis]
MFLSLPPSKSVQLVQVFLWYCFSVLFQGAPFENKVDLNLAISSLVKEANQMFRLQFTNQNIYNHAAYLLICDLPLLAVLVLLWLLKLPPDDMNCRTWIAGKTPVTPDLT